MLCLFISPAEVGISGKESQIYLSNDSMVGLLAQGIFSHHNCLLSNECEMLPQQAGP